MRQPPSDTCSRPRSETLPRRSCALLTGLTAGVQVPLTFTRHRRTVTIDASRDTRPAAPGPAPTRPGEPTAPPRAELQPAVVLLLVAAGAVAAVALWFTGTPRTLHGPADWLTNARRTFKEEKGRLVTTYDPQLGTTMKGVDPERPLPPLWKEFNALRAMPVMVIRGANSDILSPATVEAMRARHSALETLEVPDQGHAPLLSDADTIARIAEFVKRCERAVH